MKVNAPFAIKIRPAGDAVCLYIYLFFFSYSFLIVFTKGVQVSLSLSVDCLVMSAFHLTVCI